MKNLALAYIHTGDHPDNDLEKSRLIAVINLFAAVGFLITLALATRALLANDLPLAISLFITSTIFFGSHLLMRWYRSEATYKVTSTILVSCLMVLTAYLIYSGGANNTGPLWSYLVPPVALFMGGLRRGLIILAIYFCAISFLMFFDQGEHLATVYTYEFKTRLLYSFLTVTFLSGYYEYTRQQSFKTITDLSLKFEKQARCDPLTGVPNRRGMWEHLHYEYDRAQRYDLPLTVLICDIDHYKKVNDTLGHDGGDFILQEVAKLMSSSLRKQDILARWGGEEFLFLLPETNTREAFIVAEKIRSQIANAEFDYKGHKTGITVSFGLADVSDKSQIDQAINEADKRLYQAKNAGRNKTFPMH
ncbi:GGDEF domain-containing protein [Alteromonas sp. ASW11-130]|uniref:GGDEF domain-containing protein n=1 Tax=Alteromonas sp. ASW11-130 TaxID=3015775 RepID=UPI0022428C09|nr:GGDEF domain-containing protein [Alteromonas sp. ASW11-130]MCW8091080.1 GGDEF domain-containing protein [Alteromonas sp. ASW11-130]